MAIWSNAMLDPEDFDLLDAVITARDVPIGLAMLVVFYARTPDDHSELHEAQRELLDTLAEKPFGVIGSDNHPCPIDRMIEFGMLDRGLVCAAVQVTAERIRKRSKASRREDAVCP